MTTMASTVATLRQELPEVLVIVGGASVNGEYAASIGADGYAPDAVSAVKLVDSLLAHTPEHETERRA
jgi:5-methyltetrahydrofolate--homocysteine methyltransferase